MLRRRLLSPLILLVLGCVASVLLFASAALASFGVNGFDVGFTAQDGSVEAQAARTRSR